MSQSASSSATRAQRAEDVERRIKDAKQVAQGLSAKGLLSDGEVAQLAELQRRLKEVTGPIVDDAEDDTIIFVAFYHMALYDKL